MGQNRRGSSRRIAGLMMIRALVSAFLLLGFAAAGATAAELRPLDQNTLCLDGGTVIKPGFNRIKLAECNHEQTQNFRRGEKNTIYVGDLCLQALSIETPPSMDVVAAPCHGRDGQRWIMSSDGRLSSGEKLCLGIEGEGDAQRVTMVACKEKTEDRTGQRWVIYGKY